MQKWRAAGRLPAHARLTGDHDPESLDDLRSGWPPLPNALRRYVRTVDAVNHAVGRVVMYGIFVIMAVLLWSSISKTFFLPASWTLETAQFLMVAYFLLGGGHTLRRGAHVRMDLLYGAWSPRTCERVDAVTILFLIFYLCILLYGGVSSTLYAIEYGERSYSAWRPYMAPIKIVMTAAILLTLLQAVAQFLKHLAALRGEPLEEADDG